MKQSLVYLLILIFSLPSFAGGFAIDVNMTQSAETQIQSHSVDDQQEQQNHCHHASVLTAQDAPKTSNHNCCEDSGSVDGHTHFECEDNCGECSHSCSGFCVALLPPNQSAVAPQSQLQLLASVRIPAAPYQNPLIPPII